MRLIVTERRRGTAVAFLLMGLIAILAIGVVLFSRLSHRDDLKDHKDEQSTPEVITAPATDITSPTLAEPTAVDADSSTGITFPPPPPAPALSTPDPKNLPPEA